MSEPNPRGPKSGPQQRVKYCPNCRGDLRPVASNKRAAEESHSYGCQVCDWVFEINELRRDRADS